MSEIVFHVSCKNTKVHQLRLQNPPDCIQCTYLAHRGEWEYADHSLVQMSIEVTTGLPEKADLGSASLDSPSWHSSREFKSTNQCISRPVSSYLNKSVRIFNKPSSVALPRTRCAISFAGKSDHRSSNDHTQRPVSSNRVLLDDDCIRTSLPSLVDATRFRRVTHEFRHLGNDLEREARRLIRDPRSCKSVSTGTLPIISF